MNTHVALPEPAEGNDINVYTEGTSVGEIIADLSTRIPQNEYGLPQFFIRGDMIQGTSIADSDIDAASSPLSYHDGFPSLENGMPFWSQLPHEPHDAYVLFQEFIDQAQEIGIRQAAMLSGSDKTPEELMELSRLYFWSSRARAHDLFIVAAEAKKRQHRIRKMENTHYNKAGELLDQIVERFVGENEDWIEELNAKEAIEVLDTLMTIQRKSVGLTGQHASSTAREFGEGQTSNEILRQLAQQSGATQQGGDFASRLAALVDDPENGTVLQEAIIKVSRGSTPLVDDSE